MTEWLNLAASSFWRENIPLQQRRPMFLSTFGCNPKDCVELWRVLVIFGRVPRATRTVHLLWLLFFLKHYNIMAVNANIVSVTERTFREKVFGLIDALAPLVSQFVSVAKNFWVVLTNIWFNKISRILLLLITDFLGEQIWWWRLWWWQQTP